MIKLIKLVSGENVVTSLEDNGDLWKLNKPIQLLMTAEGVGMIPLSPFGTAQNLVIRKDHVIYLDDPEEEVTNAYNAQFGSGLVVPPKKGLSNLNIVT